MSLAEAIWLKLVYKAIVNALASSLGWLWHFVLNANVALHVSLAAVFFLVSWGYFSRHESLSTSLNDILNATIVGKHENTRSMNKGLEAFLLVDSSSVNREAARIALASWKRKLPGLFDRAQKAESEHEFLPICTTDASGVLRFTFTDNCRGFYGIIPSIAFPSLFGSKPPKSLDLDKCNRVTRTALLFSFLVGREFEFEWTVDSSMVRQCYLALSNGVTVISGPYNNAYAVYFGRLEPTLDLFDRPHYREARKKGKFISKEYLDVAGNGWVYTAAQYFPLPFLDANGEEGEQELKAVVYIDFEANESRQAKIAGALGRLGMRAFLLRGLATAMESAPADSFGNTGFRPIGPNGRADYDFSVPLYRWPIQQVERLLGWGIPHYYVESKDRRLALLAIRDSVINAEGTAAISNILPTKVWSHTVQGKTHFLVPIGHTSVEGATWEPDDSRFLFFTIDTPQLNRRLKYFTVASNAATGLGIAFLIAGIYSSRKRERELTEARSSFLEKSRIGCIILTSNGNLAHSNPAANDMLDIASISEKGIWEHVDQEYSDFRAKFTEAFKRGVYWPPFRVKLSAKALNAQYAERYGHYVTMALGPAELFSDSETENSKSSSATTPILGLLWAPGSSVDILRSRRVVFFSVEGSWFNDQFGAVMSQMARQAQSALIFEEVTADKTTYSISRRDEDKLRGSDFVVVGFAPETKESIHSGYVAQYLANSGIALSHRHSLVVLLVRGKDFEYDSGADLRYMVRHFDGDAKSFGDFMEHDVLRMIRGRSDQNLEYYWNSLQTEKIRGD